MKTAVQSGVSLLGSCIRKSPNNVLILSNSRSYVLNQAKIVGWGTAIPSTIGTNINPHPAHSGKIKGLWQTSYLTSYQREVWMWSHFYQHIWHWQRQFRNSMCISDIPQQKKNYTFFKKGHVQKVNYKIFLMSGWEDWRVCLGYLKNITPISDP